MITAHYTRKLISFFAVTLGASGIGLIAGLVLGMTIGGNYDPPFYYGGLPGYEGAGLLGSILGIGVACWAWVETKLKGKVLWHSKVILLITIFLVLIAEDFIARKNGNGFFFFLFLPTISQSLLFIFHRPEEILD